MQPAYAIFDPENKVRLGVGLLDRSAPFLKFCCLGKFRRASAVGGIIPAGLSNLGVLTLRDVGSFRRKGQIQCYV